MIRAATSRYFESFTFPATLLMIRLSAVNTLLGRMWLAMGSRPDAKSRSVNGTSSPSRLD